MTWATWAVAVPSPMREDLQVLRATAVEVAWSWLDLQTGMPLVWASPALSASMMISRIAGGWPC